MGTVGVPALRLTVTLLGTRPPIWRRLVIPGDWDLRRVHRALQVAMGWDGNHLHEFELGEQRWGRPIPGTATPRSGGRRWRGSTRC